MASASADLLDRLRSMLPAAESSGGRLPPERALAAELGTTRAAVRAALAQLEAGGAILRHVGRGTFVTRGLGPEARAALATGNVSPAEVMEFRIFLEPAIAGVAAGRARAADIEGLERTALGTQSATSVSGYESSDIAFHQALAEAVRNTLIVEVLRAVLGLRSHPEWRLLKEASINADRQQAYASHHLAVVNAIAARDARGAEDAMRKHLLSVRQDLLGIS